MKKEIRKPSARVFRQTQDKCAFVDKIVLSVSGKLAEGFQEEMLRVRNVGILKSGSLYARSVFGECAISGNSVTIQYGKTINFENVSDLRVTFHSEKLPVTAAQVQLFTNSATGEVADIRVSSLELTFDFSGVAMGFIKRNLYHRAAGQPRVLQDEEGRRTIYVGSPRSAWQVRIYDKTDSVIRLEFILRRPFLAKHGIQRPEHVFALRRHDIWQLLSIRRFSATCAREATKHSSADTREKILKWKNSGKPRENLLRVMRRNRVKATDIFCKTVLQRKLEGMQLRLLW